MRILFVKLSSIGDVVHTLPAAAAVRKAFPEAHIAWAVEKSASTMLEGCPAIDDLIVIDTRSVRSVRRANDAIRELKTKYRRLREGRFDVAIDFQGLIKSAAVAKLSGAERRVGFDKRNLREPAGRMLLTEQIEIPDNVHVIKKNILLAEGALGFKASSAMPEFPITVSQKEIEKADKILSAVDGEFALLNPAGGWPTKLWPAENFGKLADLLAERGLTPVVVTGPKESALAERVQSSSKSGRTIFVKPGLKEFFEIARRAKVYIGGDTGPTHIAVAAGAPVVGIFGPTEWWRNGSLDVADICVERTDIGCRENCHRRACSNWICLDIEPRTVLDAIDARIGKP